MTVWSWLVANGLYRDLLAASIAILVTHIFAWRPWRKHVQRQKQMIDLLNTQTPGGMKDVVDELRKPYTGEEVKEQDSG